VKKRSLSVLIGLSAVATAILVSAGSAASTTKSYTANICAGSPCVTNPTLAGGSTATVVLTIVNQAGTQSLGSMNVTAPAGFTVNNSVTPFPSGSSISGGLIKLRNLNITAGSTQDFNISVNVPCQSPGSSAWMITAKQSNDFNGPPGNAFTLVAPSVLTTPVAGSCKLVFVKHPANAQVNTKITSVADDPNGAEVTVEVHDASDQLITTATGSVTLDDDPSSSTTPFSGTTSSLAGGIATFSFLKSSATGTYTLVASGDGFTSSDPSHSFTISDFGTICQVNTTCTGTAGTGKTKTSVTSTGIHTETTLAITMLSAGDLPSGVCAGFTPLAGSQGVAVDVSTPPDLTRVTITLDKSIVNAKPDNGASKFDVCFGGIKVGSPGTSFTTKSGAPATFDSGTGLWWGLLPDCSGTLTQPCVESRNKTGSGNVVIVFDVPNPWDLKGYGG